jgi:membrane associated rhomboid family serine protease
MTEPRPELYETILRQCATAAPRPWYPKAFAESTGLARDTLDVALERLRMRGLIELTPWESGPGQGYRLTPDGEQVLRDAGLLDRVREGRVPAARPRPDDETGRRDGRPTPYERGEIIRDALLGRERPVVTLTLIGINVAVFVAGLVLASQQGINPGKVLSGDAPLILHQTGSVSMLDIARGQWWRLLTSCFVHIGILHIGCNMYALYVVGPLMERLLGRWRYLLLYLVAGFGGSSVGVTGGGGLAGASGAICGLLAATISWAILNRRYLPPPVLASIQRYLVINSLLIIGVSFVPGVSWRGHLGGAIFGLVAGALLNVQRFAGRGAGLAALVAVLLLPLAGVGTVLYAERSDPRLQAIRESVEITQMDRGVLPRFRQLREDGLRGYDKQVAPLLGQNPKRRDPAGVEKALALLAEGRPQLQEALEVMAKAGPYTSPELVRVQAAGEEYARQLLSLFDLSERCLREGTNWTEKDDQQLDEQIRRVKAAQEGFNKFLKPS